MTALALTLLLGQLQHGGTLPQPNLGVVFTYPGFDAAQTCYSAPLGGLAEAFTFTRATAAMIPIGGPTVLSCVSGSLRTDSVGYQSEPQTTNVCIQSQSMDNAAWTATNVVVTANSTAAPDATNTAETLTGGQDGGLLESTAASSSASVYTGSVYARSVTGTQTFDLIVRDQTGSSNLCTAAAQSATTTWARFQCTTAAATAAHNLAVRIYPGGSGATGTIIAWGAQLEVSTYATSYAITGASSVAHNTDTLKLATNPLNAADLNTGWCIALDYTPPLPTNAFTLPNLTQGLWEMSSGTHNTANNAQAYVKAGGNLSLDIRDSGNVSRTFNMSTPSAAKHRIGWCVNELGGADAGALGYVDNVLTAFTDTGTGSAIQSTMPTQITFGVLTTTSACGGQIKNVAVSRRSDVGAQL